MSEKLNSPMYSKEIIAIENEILNGAEGTNTLLDSDFLKILDKKMIDYVDSANIHSKWKYDLIQKYEEKRCYLSPWFCKDIVNIINSKEIDDIRKYCLLWYQFNLNYLSKEQIKTLKK